MKKILILLPHMICGGVEKALLALIHELPKDEYAISVRVVKSEGDFVSLIPEYVDYGEIPLGNRVREGLMLGGIKSSLKHYAEKVQLINLAKVTMKILKKDPLATLICGFNTVEELEEIYDVAICFHIHMPFIVRYVAEKVKANIKCAWIHNDFAMSGFNVKQIRNSLDCYNHYFTVSEQLLDEFISIFPEYKEKSSVAHNIVSEAYIRSSLTETDVREYSRDSINLLTIGRLDKQKGYDLAVEACSILKKKGHQFNWYVLGNGVEESNIINMIKEYGVQECFHLLGIRINPYPYIDQCDIYVQPSKHEGYGIAVAEARMLNKPIVCTDFTGARDQIITGQTGSIVGFEAEEIAASIEYLFEHKEVRVRFSNNLSNSKKSCEEELEQIVRYFK